MLLSLKELLNELEFLAAELESLRSLNAQYGLNRPELIAECVKKLTNVRMEILKRYDDSPTRWYAECPTCPAAFQYLMKDEPENPHPNGLMCPECRKRGYKLLGVLHFEAKPENKA